MIVKGPRSGQYFAGARVSPFPRSSVPKKEKLASEPPWS
jgi:hypothetical protein